MFLHLDSGLVGSWSARKTFVITVSHLSFKLCLGAREGMGGNGAFAPSVSVLVIILCGDKELSECEPGGRGLPTACHELS